MELKSNCSNKKTHLATCQGTQSQFRNNERHRSQKNLFAQFRRSSNHRSILSQLWLQQNGRLLIKAWSLQSKGYLEVKATLQFFFFDNSIVKTDIKILVGRSGLCFPFIPANRFRWFLWCYCVSHFYIVFGLAVYANLYITYGG